MHALFAHSFEMRHIVALLPLLLNIAAAATASNGDSPSLTATPSLSTSTITFPSPQAGVQTGAPPGEYITAGDYRMTLSKGWKALEAPCSPFTSLKTSSPNQWLTFIVPVKASPWIYLDISSDNASFSILINNEERLEVSNSPQSCLPQQISGSLRTDISSNITIYVDGRKAAANGNWSFQFNNFVIGNITLTNKSNSVGKNELRNGVAVYAVAVLLLSAFVVSFG